MARVVGDEVEVYLSGVEGTAEAILDQISKLGSRRPNLSAVMDRCQSSCWSIAMAIDRLRSLTGTLWEFARQYVPAVETVKLNDVVLEAVDAASFRTRRGSIDLALEPDLPPIMANRRDLCLVVTHLLENALFATVGGGRARIATTTQGTLVVLTVSDDGTGIAPDHIEKVFDPFFTTRPAGAKGLGLAVVQKIVDDHDGIIFVESVPGAGSTFTVTLGQRPSV
jgi:signal transduction histidine kinase